MRLVEATLQWWNGDLDVGICEMLNKKKPQPCALARLGGQGSAKAAVVVLQREGTVNTIP